MLLEPKVKPDLIVNENIKQKLEQLYRNPSRKSTTRKQVSPENNEISSSVTAIPNTVSLAEAQPVITSSVVRKPLKRRVTYEEPTIQDPDSEQSKSEEPPAKIKAIEPLPGPVFTPHLTTKPAIQWLYPVDPVDEQRKQSSIDNKQLQAVRQKQRQSVLSARRHLPEQLEDDAGEDP
jgi:hypothetical protein